ncbi:hypothetical protein [Methylobacterium sp. A54F]
MTRLASTAAATALTLGLFGALATSAFAQSYTAPAGIPAVTAPGGLAGTPRFEARTGDRDTLTTGSLRAARGPAYRLSGPHAGGPAGDLPRE